MSKFSTPIKNGLATYAADRPGVVAKFAELHENGTYPAKLF